jgi:ribose/xylose/arabinose/galactoside ABC-type transport system permease subunit
MSALEIGLFVAFTVLVASRIWFLKKLLMRPEFAPVRGTLILRYSAVVIFLLCIAVSSIFPPLWEGVWFDVSVGCLVAYAASFAAMFVQRNFRRKA